MLICEGKGGKAVVGGFITAAKGFIPEKELDPIIKFETPEPSLVVEDWPKFM